MTITAFYIRYWRGHSLATRHAGSAPVGIAEAPDLHLEVLSLVEKVASDCRKFGHIPAPAPAAFLIRVVV